MNDSPLDTCIWCWRQYSNLFDFVKLRFSPLHQNITMTCIAIMSYGLMKYGFFSIIVDGVLEICDIHE